MANQDPGAGSGGEQPTGKTGRNRNAYCSFCRKSYRDVGPLVEGPGDVYICAACIDLCQDIVDQEKARRQPGDPLAYYRFKIERLAQLVGDMKLRMDPRYAQSPKTSPSDAPDPEGRSG